jgi:predicted dehydrogenase
MTDLAPGLETPAVPALDYRPRLPARWRPGIALIGAGRITAAHLGAYRAAGLNVLAIHDPDRARAEARREEFFPDARITETTAEIWADDRIEVADIATHPAPRVALIKEAIRAGRHVLSQKPFVLDLDTGERLADLAQSRGVTLAVNQNGRWAPHLSWMREAVAAGLIGDVVSLHCAMHWDHNWTAGTPFDTIPDLIFYDFAIHWFDFAASVLGDRMVDVQARAVASRFQRAKPPLFAQAIVGMEDGQASFVFDGGLSFGPRDTTYVGGSAGSLSSVGPDLRKQRVTLSTAQGTVEPDLQGTWFEDGFLGTMAELLCAVEEGREPRNGARGNLAGLALCFAAIHAARTGERVRVGTVRRLR